MCLHHASGSLHHSNQCRPESSFDGAWCNIRSMPRIITRTVQDERVTSQSQSLVQRSPSVLPRGSTTKPSNGLGSSHSASSPLQRNSAGIFSVRLDRLSAYVAQSTMDVSQMSSLTVGRAFEQAASLLTQVPLTLTSCPEQEVE